MEKVIWTRKNRVHGLAYNEDLSKEAQLRSVGEVSFFTFPVFEQMENLRHGFSTRKGGVSEGHLASMNLSYSRGDEPERVDENYRRICEALGMRTADLVFSDQVHDTKVRTVGRKDCQGESLRDKKLIGYDGLATNEKEVALCTSYADCVPLFFVDPEHQAIASSHSGWRGTVGKIGAKTVETLGNNYESRPETLKVVIGPSICQDCYEVSEDVAKEFRDFVSVEKICANGLNREYVQQMCESVLVDKGNGKYQLDLWMANKLILLEAGVKEENISVSCVCTCCNHELLYSHRASNGKRGNLNGFLEIKKV